MDITQQIFSLLLLMMALNPTADALRFFLAPGKQKCLKEEIHKNVVVSGEYALSEDPNQATATIAVTDTKGHKLYSRENFVETHGKFAFTTDDYDIFEICVTLNIPQNQQHNVHNLPQREVFIDMKRGVEAKNYDDMAKAEKLKPLEVELRRLEDLSESIVADFSYMRKREEEMRSTNGF